MSKTYYKACNSTLDSVVTLPSFEVNVLKGDNKVMMIKTTDKTRKGIVTVTKWIKSCLLQCFGTFKMPILIFISVLVFRPEDQI